MLKKRSYEAELMDDLEGGGIDMAQTLKELEIINKRLGGYTVILSGIKKLLKENKFGTFPISVVDYGCGGGDTLRVLAEWARRKNIKLKLTGVDANAFIVNFARSESINYPELEYLQSDIFSNEFAEQKYDIVMCSLFCHHFTDEQLIKMFRQMKKQANIAVIINDLHRHYLAYHSIKIITKLFSKSPLVKNDGPLSVARAFTKNDLINLLNASDIKDYDIKWMWAFRWRIIFKNL